MVFTLCMHTKYVHVICHHIGCFVAVKKLKRGFWCFINVMSAKRIEHIFIHARVLVVVMVKWESWKWAMLMLYSPLRMLLPYVNWSKCRYTSQNFIWIHFYYMTKSVSSCFSGIFVLSANEVNGWVQSEKDKMCKRNNNSTFACNTTVDKISYFLSVS